MAKASRHLTSFMKSMSGRRVFHSVIPRGITYAVKKDS